MKSCKIENCTKRYYAKEYCGMHYNRARLHLPLVKVRKNTLKCSFKDCQKFQKSKGYCHTHYVHLRTYGHMNYVLNFDGKTKERDRARTKKWKKDNWATYKNYLYARKTRLKQVTPPWVDMKEIQRIYAERPEGFHVDHIIPVNGKNVTGLNVPWNLQYLSKKENLSKGNRVRN